MTLNVTRVSVFCTQIRDYCNRKEKILFGSFWCQGEVCMRYLQLDCKVRCSGRFGTLTRFGALATIRGIDTFLRAHVKETIGQF